MNVAPSSAQLPSHEEAAVTTNSTAGGVYTFPTPYQVVKNNDALLESEPSSGNSCGEFPSSGKQRMKSKKRASASSRGTQDEGSCFTASQFPGTAEEKGGGNLRTRQKQRLSYNKRGISRGFSRSSCARLQRSALRAKLWRDEKIAKSRTESVKHSPDKLSGLGAPEQGGSRVSVDGNTWRQVQGDKLAAGMAQVTAGFKAMSVGFSEVEKQIRSQVDLFSKELTEVKQRLAQVEEQQEQHKAELLRQRKDLEARQTSSDEKKLVEVKSQDGRQISSDENPAETVTKLELQTKGERSEMAPHIQPNSGVKRFEADSSQVGAQVGTQVGASPATQAKRVVKAKPVDAKVALTKVKPDVKTAVDVKPATKAKPSVAVDEPAQVGAQVVASPVTKAKSVVVKPDVKPDVKPAVDVKKPDVKPVAVKPAADVKSDVKAKPVDIKPVVKPVVDAKPDVKPTAKAKPVVVKSDVKPDVKTAVDVKPAADALVAKPVAVKPAADVKPDVKPSTKAKPVDVKPDVKAKPVAVKPAVEADKPAKADIKLATKAIDETKVNAKTDAVKAKPMEAKPVVVAVNKGETAEMEEDHYRMLQQELEMKAKLIKVLQEVKLIALILEPDQYPVWFNHKAPFSQIRFRDYGNPLIVWLQEQEMHQMQVLLDEALVLAQEILDCVYSNDGEVIKSRIPQIFLSLKMSTALKASVLSSMQIWFDLMQNWPCYGLSRVLCFVAEIHASLQWWFNAGNKLGRDQCAGIELGHSSFWLDQCIQFELGYDDDTIGFSDGSSRIDLQDAFDSVQSSLAQIDRDLSLLQQSDRGFHLLRKHGWGSTAHPYDITQSLVFQTHAPGDRSGIVFDASHARGSNRVSSSEVNVNFIPFPRARQRWHKTLREQQEKMHWL